MDPVSLGSFSARCIVGCMARTQGSLFLCGTLGGPDFFGCPDYRRDAGYGYPQRQRQGQSQRSGTFGLSVAGGHSGDHSSVWVWDVPFGGRPGVPRQRSGAIDQALRGSSRFRHSAEWKKRQPKQSSRTRRYRPATRMRFVELQRRARVSRLLSLIVNLPPELPPCVHNRHYPTFAPLRACAGI
jgi:hypothetical protein